MTRKKTGKATGKTKKRPRWGAWLTAVVVIAAALSLLHSIGEGGLFFTESKLERFMHVHHIDRSEYPPELLRLMERNKETEDFVIHYPLNKDRHYDIDLSQYEHTDSVPLLMQWDERWGYEPYGSSMIALSGCGPTCLSMVAIYLTHDTSLHPKAVAEFSTRNGYVIPGNGTSWTLMSAGGKKLGMEVIEIPLDETRIMKNLAVGNPIVCIMGPGDFTDTGHYIVMTGTENGKIRINDCNSRANSKKLWQYSDIKDQIRNLWVFR